MSDHQMTAPEIKAIPETMAAAFDDFMEAFEGFKQANDQRLGEIEQKLTADVVTRDKVERINKAMDEQSRLLDQLALKKLRPALGSNGNRGGSASLEASERKAAFEAYIRRGDETALRDLDAKSMAIGSDADGGYLVTDETDSEIGRRLASISPIRQLASVRQVSGAVLKKPFAPTGMASGWVAETTARTQTDTPQLTELSFPTMEIYAMPAATQSLLDDHSLSHRCGARSSAGEGNAHSGDPGAARPG